MLGTATKLSVNTKRRKTTRFVAVGVDIVGRGNNATGFAPYRGVRHDGEISGFYESTLLRVI